MKSTVLFCIVLALASTAWGQHDPCLRRLEMTATLRVLPEMEEHLPPDVHDGDMFTASVVYAPGDHWISGGDHGHNFRVRSWTMALGPDHVYGRRQGDNLGLLGLGGIQIRDDDPVYDDTFNCSQSGALPPAWNEHDFRLWLQDSDSMVWDDSTHLPDQLPFDEFDVWFFEVRHNYWDDGGEWNRVVVAVAEDPLFTLARASLAGDVDGDCRVDVIDLGLLVENWGETGTVADLDGDGVVGFPDLLIVLGWWGS